MAELLLDNRLLDSQNDKIRKVARVRTLTVLHRLDGERKCALLTFLHESRLIDGDETVINLNGADLTHADLSRANLFNANLAEANLSSAILNKANLGTKVEEVRKKSQSIRMKRT